MSEVSDTNINAYRLDLQDAEAELVLAKNRVAAAKQAIEDKLPPEEAKKEEKAAKKEEKAAKKVGTSQPVIEQKGKK